MTEEKKADIAVAAVATNVAAASQAIPAMVDAKTAAPIVLSQAPPFVPSDAKPVVDKASSVVAHPFAEKK